MKLILIILIFTLTYAELPSQRPIIGIYTQSTNSDQPTLSSTQNIYSAPLTNQSYIAASYVKYVQMSGAQVIPIFAYNDKSYFDDILPKINGILFPGGDMEININHKWTQNADYILKYATNQNNKGNVFPIWGTCQGMQLLAYLTSGYDAKAIAPVRGEVAVRNTIKITPQSTIFKGLSSDLSMRLESGDGILYFNHHFAVTKTYFDNNALLRKYWNVEAYTTTSYSQQFLSIFKAKDYPFYGVQFHPQKNLYQWKIYGIRSQSGAQIVQYFSNIFIEDARHSKNHFLSNEQFFKHSIYNYKSKSTTMSFISIYVFKQDTLSQYNLNRQQ